MPIKRWPLAGKDDDTEANADAVKFLVRNAFRQREEATELETQARILRGQANNSIALAEEIDLNETKASIKRETRNQNRRDKRRSG